MLFDNNYKNNEIELVKLISFAYDLYEDKLDYFNSECDLFPRWYTYNHNSYDVARIRDGIVWGFRGYASHSECKVFTNLGVTVGKIVNNTLQFDYAISFDVNNEDSNVYTCLLECKDDTRNKPELIANDKWHELDENGRIELFVKSMVVLGFREEDVKAVIDGTMTAREAYMNIAPEEKKYRQWVDFERRYYEFDGNVAIDGHFGNIRNFDTFPFPFEGEAIIDCSRAKTGGIKLDKNRRRIRLINVNENKKSILYANLRNAIIDEVIDLSKVDATGTKFGHQKVSNLFYSIASLKNMNLTLATDEDGNFFEVDEKGRSKIDGFGDLVLLKQDEEVVNINSNINVLANVDTEEMAKQTLDTNRDGIGLIRTETLFYSAGKIEKYIPLFLTDDYDIDDNLLEEFKMEQENLLESIFNHLKDEVVTIRLFDFRLGDILRYLKKSEEELLVEYYCYGLVDSRGVDYFECYHSKLLEAQVKAIFTVCKKYNQKINILVPYIEQVDSIEFIKKFILNINQEYQVEYKLGAMIENLSSVYNCDQISSLVDFISFGLNDLTESVLRKSRDTKDSDFYYLNNEVKGFINEAIYRAKRGNKNIQIGVCGEHTNYIENLDFLTSIGIQYISAIPSMIPILKENLSRIEQNPVLIKK